MDEFIHLWKFLQVVICTCMKLELSFADVSVSGDLALTSGGAIYFTNESELSGLF